MVSKTSAAKDSKKKITPTTEAITTVPPEVPASVDATETNVPPTKADNANVAPISAIKETTALMSCNKSRN